MSSRCLVTTLLAVVSLATAGHAAEAVRLWLQSGLERTLREPWGQCEPEDGRRLSPYNDFGRMVRDRMPGVIDEDERESAPPIEPRSKKRG